MAKQSAGHRSGQPPRTKSEILFSFNLQTSQVVILPVLHIIHGSFIVFTTYFRDSQLAAYTYMAETQAMVT